VIALALVIGLGALLLMLPWVTEDGAATPPVDALLTAVSAACVTGLVTVDTASHWNRLGEALVLLLIQAGGLGFTVGASLILQVLRRGTSLRDALLLQDGAPTLSLREAVDLSKRIIRFTVLCEAVGALLLTARFAADMPLDRALWHGVFHAVSAFCNAGFDLQGGFASLLPYRDSLWVNAVIAGLIQAGALSYIVLADVWTTRAWRRLALDTKLVLVVNAALLLGGAVVFAGVEWDASLAGQPAWARVMGAVFQSVAARTAGFASVNLAEVQTATLFVWVGLMAIGGASGSTAGGVKLTTVGVVATAVYSTLRGEEEAQVFGRRLPTPLVFRAMAVIALFLLFHFLATLLLALSEDLGGDRDFPFIALMFEAMSGLATVGLSTGITPALTDAGKLILCGTMFLGRIGPLTLAYALQRRQHRARFRFAETPVRIG
jgi:trk system potassium uptake protein TrkH